MSTNYAILVPQGRAKAHGVPWSDAEFASVIAITKAFNYPTFREAAEYVRRGARTVEDVKNLREEAAEFLKENGHKPIEAMSREELEDHVRSLNPDTTVTKDAPKNVLEGEAKEAEKAKAEADAKAAADARAKAKAEADAKAKAAAKKKVEGDKKK